MTNESPTLQQVADMATRGLLAQMQRCQKERNSDGYPTCLYSDDAGNHCAIGWALTSDLQTLVEDYLGDIRELCADFPLVNSYFINCALDALRELQQIHDDDPPQNWRTALLQFYRDHNLKFPEDV